MGLFRRPSLNRILGISAAKARMSRQLGFSVTDLAKGKFTPTKWRPRAGSSRAGRSASSAAGYSPTGGFSSAPAHVTTVPHAAATVVRISAKVLQWPQSCPCCLGPTDTAIQVNYTRTTGVRVVKEDTKGWAVPYCSACQNFDRLYPAEAEARQGLQDVTQTATDELEAVRDQVAKVLGQLRLDLTRLQHFRPPSLAAVLIALVAGGFLLALAAGYFSAWAFLAVMVVVGLVAAPVILRWPAISGGIRAWHARRVARLERTIRAEEEAGRHAIAEVQAEGRRVVAEAQARHRQLSGDLQRFGRAGRVPFGVPAVDYHGWEGTVHTFAFGNPKYAEAFKQANADKRIV